jgi:hypothetical protein
VESNVETTIATLKGIPTREELLEMLHTNLVTVVFTKLSGDERTMICTLLPSFLPQAKAEDPLSQTKVRKLEDNLIVAWEPKTGGFRSFRYDRVKSVELFFI